MDENYWREKDDEEVIAAASHLSDYTEAAQGLILAEMQWRSLSEKSLQIQEKEIPEGRKSRIPSWVLFAIPHYIRARRGTECFARIAAPKIRGARNFAPAAGLT